MWMTDQRRKFRIARAPIQNRFQLAGLASKRKAA
jgi:hypothetical protein